MMYTGIYKVHVQKWSKQNPVIPNTTIGANVVKYVIRVKKLYLSYYYLLIV